VTMLSISLAGDALANEYRDSKSGRPPWAAEPRRAPRLPLEPEETAMTTLRFRSTAAALAALVAILLGPFSDFAMARTVNLGTISKGGLQSACSAAGGNYGEVGGGYGCTKSCGGHAGGCAIYCEKNGKCTGYTPNNIPRRGAGTVGGVLSGSAGTASAAGGTASNKKPPLHNVTQPVVIQHSGGARSGGSKH